jgi:SAM-dependent methyltransferase
MYQYNKKKLTKQRNIGVKEIFNNIYKSNFWNSTESFSGTGSDLEQTEVIREALPRLVVKYEIKTMLDIPCGDFNWMQHVQLNDVHYTGCDIVAALVEQNTRNYSSQNQEFKILNIIEDSLPKVDLIFCRDCLVHFSYEHIEKALNNVKRSGSKFLLTTSFINRRLNFDIETGDWRPINLQIKPFSLPDPLEVIIEKCTEGNGKSYDKALLLYRVSDL